MEVVKSVEVNQISSTLNFPKIQKRQRRKSNYKKINNQTRQKLIEMVYLKDFLLKDAAKVLGINYSTAKTILRIFRIEKRIEKKNADEERELKKVIFLHKNKTIQQALNTKSETPSENFNSIDNKLKQSNSDIVVPKIAINLEDKKYSSISHINDLQAIQSLKDSIENFTQNIHDLSSTLNQCHIQIQNNQHMINILLTFINLLRNLGKSGILHSSSNSSVDINTTTKDIYSPIYFHDISYCNLFEKIQPINKELIFIKECFDKYSKVYNP